MNPLDARCNVKRDDAVCVNHLKNAAEIDHSILLERPDVKIFLPFRFHIYQPHELFHPNNYAHYLGTYVLNLLNYFYSLNRTNSFTVAADGDHLMSLIDEISYKPPSAPMISQIHDIPPESFCNGDNRPPNCGPTCTCTHKVDVPLNAIVEIVLVDEGIHE